MSEEDDWFERAIRETDEESDEPPVDGAEGGSDGGEGGSDGAEADVDNGESGTDDPAGEPAAASSDTESADRFGGADDETGTEAADEDPFGSAVDDDPDAGGDEAGGGSASGGVPADAFGDIDADADAGFGSFGEDDPFGGGGGGDADAGADTGADTDSGSGGGGADAFGADDPFGGGRGGGGSGGDSSAGTEGGGDDPFGGYRGGAGAVDDDFGFGEFGGDADAGGATDFDVDPDEFESGIDRTDIGIKGLDDMILGGVPSRSLLSVIGGAGTGKTTFALQFLNHALESGNKGIYITLEQTRESILDTASEKGWSFREHAAEDRLAVVAIDPIEMANSLASIRNDLVRLIAEFDADRLVLDSVSLLEMMYDHPAKRRSEVFGFTRSLKEAGVTTLLTSEASEENPYASRHGIVEYLTDAVFVLQYVRGSDFRETRLAVEIQKIRDANHSRETKPYDITDTGISVYDQANIF
ncbi:KaiC domain protein, AF_0351 family [Halorubrum xinjiangense]|uniref:KaiC domain protein, AF_0351 family n=1 Tax=Halorubrum xinjiangense TaxID=261291 RepID=A0A1G7SDS2_9EURY|nr:KaiC domain-containing protein [Halorubrum xinjiangense]SDG21225.1 KaiC domain protein, AF_0351 family [Halorubrum xinjiangense]